MVTGPWPAEGVEIVDFANVSDRYSDSEIESYYDTGLWRHDNLSQVVDRQALEHPEKVFVTDGKTALTYFELWDSALRLAHGFRQLGIGRGDRVSVQIPSWAEFAQIAVALSRIGA